MRKILILLLILLSSSLFAQTVGETDSPYDIDGWDSPEDSTAYYNLAIFRLLSNPGGWINRNTRAIDSLLNELIIYTDTNSLYIENDTLKMRDSVKVTSTIQLAPAIDSTLTYINDTLSVAPDTTWDDLRFPASQITPGPANPPDWVNFSGLGGVYGLAFNQNTEEDVYFIAQMPHSWVEGSEIRPHIHWTSSTGTAGTVVWGLEYTKASPLGTFGSTVTDTMRVSNPSQYYHQLDGFDPIDMTGNTISTIIWCRLYRDADDAADDLAEDAYLLDIDFHFQSDLKGSHEEYTK
jgi:hypothetical protein